MNFEVSGGKVYKGVGCQSLGCNWERIESLHPSKKCGLSSAGCNWERIERGVLENRLAAVVAPAVVPAFSCNWERIESKTASSDLLSTVTKPCCNWERIERYYGVMD